MCTLCVCVAPSLFIIDSHCNDVRLFFSLQFHLYCILIQINYLIDEGQVIQKGSELVINLLDHFFSNWGMGEDHAELHADNCTGQNKNNFVIWYLLWRVMTGRHKSITYSFMISGHTKFLPDGGFGLIKQKYRRTPVSCLQDVATMVDASSTMNTAQLMGHEDGEVIVTQRAWNAYLSTIFKTLPNMTSRYHFRYVYKHLYSRCHNSFDIIQFTHQVCAVRANLDNIFPT